MKFDEAMLMLRAGFKSSAAADAAEFAAEETGEYSLTASDEILYISDAFLSLRES